MTPSVQGVRKGNFFRGRGWGTTLHIFNQQPIQRLLTKVICACKRIRFFLSNCAVFSFGFAVSPSGGIEPFTSVPRSQLCSPPCRVKCGSKALMTPSNLTASHSAKTILSFLG